MDNTSVITVVGRRKLCMAHTGEASLPPITRMAWGDGGLDESGQPKATTGNEVGLYHELLVKDIEGYEYIDDDQTSCRYTAILEADDLAGEEISEMGLYDAEGDLVVYRTCMRKGKEPDISQKYQMEEIFVPK